MRFCPLPLPGFLENRGRQLLPHLPLSRGLGGSMVAGPCWWGSGSSSLATPCRGGTWLYQLDCHREQSAIRHRGRESEPVTRLLMITHPPAVLSSACLCARPRWEPPKPASRAPLAARTPHGSPSPSPDLLRARGHAGRRRRAPSGAGERGARAGVSEGLSDSRAAPNRVSCPSCSMSEVPAPCWQLAGLLISVRRYNGEGVQRGPPTA